MKCHPPLMLLSYAFGICPPRSSLRPGLGLPCGRPPPRRSPKVPPCRSTPPSLLFQKRPPASKESVVLLLASSPRLSRFLAACATSAGSLRQRVPTTHANPRSRGRAATLRPHHRPAGFASPGSSRVADLPALFHAGSSLGTLTFRGFSPSSPRGPLGLRCPPCRLSPCGVAAPRISAIQRSQPPSSPGKPDDPAIFYTSRCSASLRMDAFAAVDVVHASDRSLLSWSLSPFEDDLPASLRTSTELLSWASIVHPRPSAPLAGHLEPR
jgi:hypothetical protein